MSIVPLSLAKLHLNIVGNDDDELISFYIGAAEAYLSNFIGRRLADIIPVENDLQKAVLDLAAFYYAQREAVSFGVAMNLAPCGVIEIANFYRKSFFGEGATDGE